MVLLPWPGWRRSIRPTQKTAKPPPYLVTNKYLCTTGYLFTNQLASLRFYISLLVVRWFRFASIYLSLLEVSWLRFAFI